MGVEAGWPGRLLLHGRPLQAPLTARQPAACPAAGLGRRGTASSAAGGQGDVLGGRWLACMRCDVFELGRRQLQRKQPGTPPLAFTTAASGVIWLCPLSTPSFSATLPLLYRDGSRCPMVHWLPRYTRTPCSRGAAQAKGSGRQRRCMLLDANAAQLVYRPTFLRCSLSQGSHPLSGRSGMLPAGRLGGGVHARTKRSVTRAKTSLARPPAHPRRMLPAQCRARPAPPGRLHRWGGGREVGTMR